MTYTVITPDIMQNTALSELSPSTKEAKHHLKKHGWTQGQAAQPLEVAA